MIVVHLSGGTGNQLFQYAAAKTLSIQHNTLLLLDVSAFLKKELPKLEIKYNLELYNFAGITDPTVNMLQLNPADDVPNFKTGLIQKFLPNYKRDIYKEPHFHYDKNFNKSRDNIYLRGGWQSYKYFESEKTEIVNRIKLKFNDEERIKYDALIAGNENIVAVHVRRGDYLRLPEILDWHGVMDKVYYANAFEVLAKKGVLNKVRYFTNDPEWVLNELCPLMPGQILSNDLSPNQYSDFYLMQHCSHNIIANSSFSWWAAYLNPNPNKIVIAPKKWFNKAPYDTKDLIPQSWIRI